MSKRKRTSNIEKWIKEGRGAGIGADKGPDCLGILYNKIKSFLDRGYKNG
ncbi:hypothetical protein [Bacillus altitudinis]|nr:hypothetical protein [Bacillus altitudinis]